VAALLKLAERVSVVYLCGWAGNLQRTRPEHVLTPVCWGPRVVLGQQCA
jgi:hypothetical protein